MAVDWPLNPAGGCRPMSGPFGGAAPLPEMETVRAAEGALIQTGVNRREGGSHQAGSVQCQRRPVSAGAFSILSISAATA